MRFRFVSRTDLSRVSSCGVGWCTSVLVVVIMAAVTESNLHFNHDCARRTCVENTFSPRTTSGARTVTFMAGSDNPSANVNLPGNVHAQPTPTNDGAGLDNVSVADPSAFHISSTASISRAHVWAYWGKGFICGTGLQMAVLRVTHPPSPCRATRQGVFRCLYRLPRLSPRLMSRRQLV